MHNKLKNFLNIRNIILITLSLFCLLTSFYLYGRNKSKVFKDEYMESIFVEEENTKLYMEKDGMESEGVTNINYNNENKILVEIKGEVKNPDVYEIEEGSIIRDLINLAGGLTKDANIDLINRAEELRNNQLIVIPNNDEIATGVVSNIITDSNKEIININTASLNELQEINGIGEVKAQSIIEYRENNGKFKSIDEIKNVEGIGSKTFDKIKDKIAI